MASSFDFEAEMASLADFEAGVASKFGWASSLSFEAVCEVEEAGSFEVGFWEMP